ncbi:MAG: 50S ribosomal protein L24 [candidate division SR1 bacterium]|nr:50S ribosomal protein L24 [candidate division SR1 bacterium]
MKKLRVGDPVIVIAGKHKGKISTIQAVGGEKVTVKGVNEVKKAMKGKGFIKKTLPIHISNVMYYLETEKKGTRIAIVTDKKDKLTRQSKKTNKPVK